MRQFSRSGFISLLSDKNLFGPSHNTIASSGDIDRNAIVNANHAKDLGLKPYRGNWGREQILHLVRRTLFGVTSADYNYFAKLTLNECLDKLFAPSPLPEPPVNVYNDSSYTDPDIPYGQTWVLCPNMNTGVVKEKRRHSLVAWWAGQKLNQDRSLSEKMTLFLHNHIAVEFKFINDAQSSYAYVAHLRSHALGNFKKLILEISTCTAMLEYLGGVESTGEAPNENYARELQELFTVGKGPGSNYTQDDVVAAARVLTGWTFDTRIKARFVSQRHDNGDKQFSAFYNNTKITGKKGQAGADEVKELIDMICGTKEVARNLSRCLYRWFVNSFIDAHVEKNVIEPMTDIFIENDFEIAPALRALLCSEHFFDKNRMGQQIKNPVDYFIGICRQFNVTSFPSNLGKQYQLWDSLSDKLYELSMQPGTPPNVAGWPAYYLFPSYDKLWVNSDTLVSKDLIIDLVFRPGGMEIENKDISINMDVLGFTAQLSNPADVNHLITESTQLLSPVEFDRVQSYFLKTLLLGGPEQYRMSGEPDHRPWSDAWNAYTVNQNDNAAKNVVLNRLYPYYCYLLKQPECQLY